MANIAQSTHFFLGLAQFKVQVCCLDKGAHRFSYGKRLCRYQL